MSFRTTLFDRRGWRKNRDSVFAKNFNDIDHNTNASVERLERVVENGAGGMNGNGILNRDRDNIDPGAIGQPELKNWRYHLTNEHL